MAYGKRGRIHGFDTYVLADEAGEPLPVYSIASGLDYPGVGPEHAYLRDAGRVNYVTASDDEAMEAFFLLSRYEGIIPAVESSHAVAYAIKYAKEHGTGSILVYQGNSPAVTTAEGDVVNVSGTTSMYGGLLQFAAGSAVEKTGTATVTHPTVTVMDGAAMDAFLSAPAVKYIESSSRIQRFLSFRLQLCP